MKNQDYLYLDHAASTPMRTSALEKYVEAESFGFANSSGGHKLSRDSKNLLEDSREKIAGLFNAAPGEIIFTSGGTEADNWTIKSLFESINDLSKESVNSPKVSIKFGDEIEGAPISIPIKFSFLSNKFNTIFSNYINLINFKTLLIIFL